MTSFYSVGGAMLSGAQIANRAAEASGAAPVTMNKEALVTKIVELSAAAGKNISAVQKKKYADMRRDQLEKLIGDLSKPRGVAPKTEVK